MLSITFRKFLTADNTPVRFPPGPSLSGIGSRRFAFVVRLESQAPLMGFESARRSTLGTFHERNPTRQKTLEGNVDHPRKLAFGRCGGWQRRLFPRASLRHLYGGRRRW